MLNTRPSTRAAERLRSLRNSQQVSSASASSDSESDGERHAPKDDEDPLSISLPPPPPGLFSPKSMRVYRAFGLASSTSSYTDRSESEDDSYEDDTGRGSASDSEISLAGASSKNEPKLRSPPLIFRPLISSRRSSPPPPTSAIDVDSDQDELDRSRRSSKTFGRNSNSGLKGDGVRGFSFKRALYFPPPRRLPLPTASQSAPHSPGGSYLNYTPKPDLGALFFSQITFFVFTLSIFKKL